jgi:hypothetical protein
MSNFKYYLEKAQDITEGGYESILEDETKIKAIRALTSFKNAYNQLLNADWDILNELEANELYPFKESFDEINIVEWVLNAIKEIESKMNRSI